MTVIRVETVAEEDGELRIPNLPCRKGDRAEAIILLPETPSETGREAARLRFLERARASKFRSQTPYPQRDELHERS